MGKTTHSHKGKSYRPTRHDQKKKRRDKKFFGFTSGSHSRGVQVRQVVDDEVVYVDSDRPPIKGEDFVKYGWPFETRHPKVVRNLELERQARAEIKRAKYEEED